MKKKFILFLLGILVMISCASVSTNHVQASYASRHHLSAYVMPIKYRGNWKGSHHFRIHVTSRRIWGTYNEGQHALTYKSSFKQYMKLPGQSKLNTILVWHGGKWLVWAYPSSQPSSMRRSGSHLIVQIDTWRFKCRRY